MSMGFGTFDAGLFTLALIIGVIFLGFLLLEAVNYLNNVTSPKVTTKATCIRKERKSRKGVIYYYLLFDMPELHQYRRFQVDGDIFHQINAKDIGMIVFQREWLEEFNVIAEK